MPKMGIYSLTMNALCFIPGFLTGTPTEFQTTNAPPAVTTPATKSSGTQHKAHFTPGNAGEIELNYGVQLAFEDFKASDGSGLRMLYWYFDNPAQASEVFKKEVAHALKIVNQGQKKDATGKLVGERAQIQVQSSTPGIPAVAVVWTDGGTFREIRSRSLNDVLDLEKLYSDRQEYSPKR